MTGNELVSFLVEVSLVTRAGAEDSLGILIPNDSIKLSASTVCLSDQEEGGKDSNPCVC